MYVYFLLLFKSLSFTFIFATFKFVSLEFTLYTVVVLHCLNTQTTLIREVSLELKKSQPKEHKRVDKMILANLLVIEIYHLITCGFYTF